MAKDAQEIVIVTGEYAKLSRSSTTESLDSLSASSTIDVGTSSVLEGTLGLPFAVKEAGFFTGIIVLSLVAYLTHISLNILVHSGRKAHIYQYGLLAEYSLGRCAFYILNFISWVDCFGSAITYLMIVGDTLPLLGQMYFPNMEILQSRSRVIITASLLLVFPLCFWRTPSPLAKLSVISAICLPIISIIIGLRAPLYAKEHHTEYNWFGDNVFPAIGIMSFSYVTTPVAFMNYLSLSNANFQRWKSTTGLAVGGSLLCFLSFAIVGYSSFGDQIMHDHQYDTHIPNDARSTMNVLLAFETETKLPTLKEHLFTTISLFFLCITSSVFITDLGKTYALIG
ncbi:hypothetical protein K7432_008259, partial [Basidiobolus ranarum]